MSAREQLNARQQLFCETLIADPERNATRAYELVYTSRGNAAAVNASKLMGRPEVAAYLDELTEGNRERNQLTADLVLNELMQIVMADPRQLIEYRRGACRHCYGINFQYQRTPAAYERDFEAYKLLAKGRDDLGLHFPVKGGIGFSPKRAPHPDCPECHGDGVGYSHARDSRTLPPAAARLFAGIKETREGLQLLTRSQDKALELALRHLGLLNDKDRDPDSENNRPPPSTVTYNMVDGRQPGAPDGSDK